MIQITSKRTFNSPFAIALLFGLGILLIVGIIIESPKDAHSAVYNNPDGSTLQVDITANVTDGPDVTNLCPAGRNKPNFTAYIETPSINIDLAPNADGQSLLRYDLTVKWRTCDRNTQGYALYGKKFCPESGYYGGEGTRDPDREEENYLTYDCVKYIDNVNDFTNNPALGCPYLGGSTKNPGFPCTLLDARQLNVFKKAPQPDKTGATVLVIPGLTKSIGGRPNANTTNSNSDSYGGKICQYFWFANESAQQSDNSVCVNLRIDYKWVYTPAPTYDLKATVSNLQSTFTYDTTGAVNWGAYAHSAANLQAGGVGYHEVDLWKIRFDGNPNYIAADTPTLGDGDLCSSYITGESGCIRAAAVGCPPGNPTYSCPNSINAAGESWGFSYASAVETYPVGTSICYVARVKNPTQSPADDAVWRTSSMICSTSGTQPKVQSWGYDLKATGRIKTSLTDVGGRRYGSWGEYGVLSNGSTIGMASGSGLLGGEIAGAAQDDWSPLTFANDIGSAPGCGFGCFGGVAMPAVSTQGEVVRPDGYRVSSMAQLRADLGSGKGKLRVNGTLYIDGDLTYANPGAGVGIVGLEKVQLIANDIVVAGGVQTIDPWLIAYNASTNTYGRISTCADVNSGGNFFVPMGTTGLLRAGLCGSPLKFNSPVIADQIYLYRTADNREGTVAAETFNVRADNFLSSYVGGGPAQPVATTDSITELPPRF